VTVYQRQSTAITNYQLPITNAVGGHWSLVIGHWSLRFIPVALLALAAIATTACDEVNREAFAGIKGAVGYPPISDCHVEIYNALSFKSLDSTEGRIAQGRTNGAGRFSIELSERYLGRPMILVARPDSRAMYRDFGAPGTPIVPFDAPRQPWVAVMNDWLGGEDIVSINPITTVAFHSLMRLPIEQTGPGTLRFDRNITLAVHAATAANFGFRSGIGSENPAPPDGPGFAEPKPFYLEENARSVSYTYACLQLAKTANEFVNTTADPNDRALDFYEALFRDAQDGVLDGQYFGTPDPFLNAVPSVVGRDVDGASRLFQFLASLPLDLGEQEIAGAANDGSFDPKPVDMIAIQNTATGALRPSRVDSFDVLNFPYSGNVEVTLRGHGFRRTDQFIFRQGNNNDTDFRVTRTSVGVDGEFLYHSDTELRMRIPDFAVTTKAVHEKLMVPGNDDFRVLRLILQNMPEIFDNKRSLNHVLTTDARVTNRTEPLLIHTEIGRVDAPGTLDRVPSGNNIYDAATDPATLDPATQHVYELRVRVCNPGPEAVNNLGLNFTLSAFSQLGNPVVADVFGGAAAARAVIFADPLPSVTLNPGEVARLDYRVIFLDTAIGVELAAGAPVRFTPVLEGVSAGAGTPLVSTGDVVGFNRSAELAPVDPDATPLLEALAAPTLPGAVTAGDALEIRIDLSASPAAGGAMRTLRVTDVEVAVNFDGADSVIHLSDAFFRTTGDSGLAFVGARLDSDGGRAMPVSLTQAADADAVIVTIQTEPGITGALSATCTARAIDPSTGVVSTQTSPSGNTTVVP
jgi:hypothetical protein